MLMLNRKVVRFSKVKWIANKPPIISPLSSPSTFCPSPSPPPNSSSPCSSPTPNPNKRQQMDWDWDLLTPQIPCLYLPKETTRTYKMKQMATPLLSDQIYRARNTSPVPPNNADEGVDLQQNARLTRNQAHKQGILLPLTSSYYAYTNTLPLFSLLSAALPLDPI